MSNRPIAVFDSGVGSLSIIKELKAEIPTEDLIYFADRENFPYGTKSPEQLNEIMIKSIKSLEPYSPKLIIMASNTPSVQVLENIRECTSIPIMGVKPPLAEAARLTKKKHIGIMATESTLRSIQLRQQIAREVPQKIFVTRINASPLIRVIEDGSFFASNEIRQAVLDSTFQPEAEDIIDVITLSSTHLPLIKDYLESLFSTIKFVDPAHNTAKDVKKFLKDTGISKKTGTGKMLVFVTGDKIEFQQALRQMGFKYKVQSISTPF